MQADQKPVIWTVVIATLLILVLGGIGIGSFSSNVGNKLDVMNQKLEGLDIDEQAIANAIVAGIILPEYDTEKIDKLCEMTEGYESETSWNALLSHVEDKDDAAEDFYELFGDLIGLDYEDEFTLKEFNVKDHQIRAYTEDDKDDHSWTVKVFARVEYKDVDADPLDREVVYIVITSVLDEGEYDSMTVEEVSRNFEF